MPIPTSKRQFRFLQAVAHGNARDAHGLSPSSAKAGLSEFGGRYSDLPARARAIKKRAKRSRR